MNRRLHPNQPTYEYLNFSTSIALSLSAKNFQYKGMAVVRVAQLSKLPNLRGGKNTHNGAKHP
jgi:hypothetical protein